MSQRITLKNSINNQVQSMFDIDGILFNDKKHDDFMVITDQENVAGYIQGRTGDNASIIPITTDVKDYDLWIVHTGDKKFQNKSVKRKWIQNDMMWEEFINNDIDEV